MAFNRAWTVNCENSQPHFRDKRARTSNSGEDAPLVRGISRREAAESGPWAMADVGFGRNPQSGRSILLFLWWVVLEQFGHGFLNVLLLLLSLGLGIDGLAGRSSPH